MIAKWKREKKCFDTVYRLEGTDIYIQKSKYGGRITGYWTAWEVRRDKEWRPVKENIELLRDAKTWVLKNLL